MRNRLLNDGEFVIGEFAQHVVREVAAMFGRANAEAQSSKGIFPKFLNNIFQAVLSAVRAIRTNAHGTQRQIHIVAYHKQIIDADFVESKRVLNGFA
jgi:hypothetical protein